MSFQIYQLCDSALMQIDPIRPHLQMANRANSHSASPSTDQMTQAFQRAGISEPQHPPLKATQTAPARPGGGLAARRAKPVFKVSDITGDSIGGGGASGAGLGVGRPNLADKFPARRPNVMDNPFSNFGKIVCVCRPLITSSALTALHDLSPVCINTAIRRAL